MSDPERKVAKQYGLVTGDGKYPARWTFYIGKDRKILHIDKKVDVKTHGRDIAAKLAELKVEKRKKSK